MTFERVWENNSRSLRPTKSTILCLLEPRKGSRFVEMYVDDDDDDDDDDDLL
jgi:hypothetical protein